jgi:hypothetical protein
MKLKQRIQKLVGETLNRLDEKLITYGSRKPYGQIVFMAGGAGSGKGFAISNFVDSASFKVRDVDEWKKAFMRLDDLKKKYPEVRNLNLKNPDDVYKLHMFVKKLGVKDKTLLLMLSQAEVGRLPNILFDVTLKDMGDITEVMPFLLKAGYEPKNIHLTWVLTSYHLAVVRNRDRERVVPDDILLNTHKGAAKTVHSILTKKLPKGLNGRIDVILNNSEHTVFFQDNKGNKIKVSPKFKGTKTVVQDFLYLPIKKEGGSVLPEKVWKKTLFHWMRNNIPKTIKSDIF